MKKFKIGLWQQGTSLVISQVDWKMFVSVLLLSRLISLLISVKGLVELKE